MSTLRRLLLHLLLLVPFYRPLFAQAHDPSIPTDLSPTDPEIRSLLNIFDSSCRAAKLTANMEHLQKALEIADRRGLIGDRAVIEVSIASANILGQGEVEQGFLLLQKALQDSIDAKREILETDILISLAAQMQMKGNIEQGIALLNKAILLSGKSGNLYGKARALGELGKLELQIGKINEAGTAIDQALNIDRLNGYSFEALHLFYKGTYLGVIGKTDEAMQSIEESKRRAAMKKDPYTFVLAEDSYAFGLVKKGKTDEAMKQMNMLGTGDLQELLPDPTERDCVASYLQLPLPRLVWLEGFTNVLEAANQTEKEIGIWKEVYSLSEGLNLVAGEAEAKHRIADLENRLKRGEEALKDYEAAASLYKNIGNENLLNQVDVSESLLLVQLGRGKEAVPIVEQIVAYAKSHDLLKLEFSAYLELAEIFQPAGDTNNTRAVLEKAESLVRPGPFDAQMDNHLVYEAYIRLSDVYKTLGMPTRELTSIDKAFFVAVHLHDDKSQNTELNYLDERLGELHVRELVGERQQSGQLAESLIYSYILYLRDGYPSKPTDDQSNWQRILRLPFQIAQQPQGDATLIEILGDVGPMFGSAKLPILNALGRYYITEGSDPILAEKYAMEAENVIKEMKGETDVLMVEPSCILALSYARQNKSRLASQRNAECMRLATKTNDQQTMTYAQAVNVMVETQTGDLASAKSSLENLIAKSPDNPELQIELVMSLVSAKLYGEGDSQLAVATTKLIAAGDKKTAAGAFKRVAVVLNVDPSDNAKELQLKYLTSALQEYRESGAAAEEAETLILLGDYYVKVTQGKNAIDSYRAAQDLAEQRGHPNIIAQALLGLGNAYESQKDFVKARDFHLQAASAFHKLDNSFGETMSLRNLGAEYLKLGDTDRALSSLLDARRAASNTGTLNRYLAAYFLGDFYRSQGQFEKALTSFQEAAEITAHDGDLEHSAYSHLAISGVDVVIGTWEEAISEAEISLGLFEKIGNKEGQSDCWAQLTSIYSDRSSPFKDFEKAQEFYKKAQDLGFGKTLQLDLLEIYLQTGRYSEAATIARESIQYCVKEKNTDCQAHGLISLSEANRLNGNLKESRSALNEARPIVSKSQEVYLRGRLIYAESKLLTSEGRLDAAVRSYRQLISLIEDVKGKLDTQNQRSLSENYGYIYDEFVSVLYSTSQKAGNNRLELSSEALNYAEKNKARQFAESWGRVFENQMRLALPPDLQEREQALSSKRDRLRVRLEAASESADSNERAEMAGLEADLSNVKNEIQVFVRDLRKVSPQYAAIAYPEEIQISSLPLRQGEALVEFKVTENSTFVWIVKNQSGNRNELKMFYEVPQKRAWFTDRVSLVRNALNSGHADAVDWKISEELFAALFPKEVEQIIADTQDIIFVPDDVLFVLPFELLSPGASKGEFLLLNKATTYYPSAVSLKLERTATHPSVWQAAFLGIADPITSPEDERFELVSELRPPDNRESERGIETQNQDNQQPRAAEPERLKSRGYSFERLPGTATEVKAVAGLLRARKEIVDVRFGANASKQRLLDTDLTQFRFVHFATHGVLPVDTDIQEPSLVLSYDGVSPAHMFLSMSEILNLKLRSESVVLSACNTGSGKISKAEGVMSLGRAFLAAGSESVTVSLWQVSDESTDVLMESYYKGLLENKKKSAALAEARYAVFKSGSKNPYFWAPFIVIGE
jgi:CHAT domain-containing protein